MKTNFPKHYSSPSQIISFLKNRGMVFTNEAKAEKYLINLGYHRLSAYIYPFYELPKNDLILKNNTTFDKVLALYRFDKKLRILLFNEIEKIEVSIRSVLANYGCMILQDDYWISERSYFANEIKFNKTLEVLDKELNGSKEDFIVDFKTLYIESYPPAWMITEVISFGNLNYIYSNIANNKLRKQISDYFGVKPKVFESWQTVLSNLRNMCCHHGRVWNREFVIKPVEAQTMKFAWIDTSKLDNKRVYYRLCIIKYMLNIISPNNDMRDKLSILLKEFPQIDISAMGFTSDWDKESLWL